MVLEKTLESALDSKEMEINPEYSLEGLMLKLKLQYFGHMMWNVNNWLPGKDTDAGKDWGQKEKRVAEMRWLESNTDSLDMNLSELQETVMDREPGLL